ncbi:hypothetical protein [Catenulispora pinisilvae]|uniref:hypothetical protein n=1 Tax=Catenulispora pinisilvae TaxID=2705253 RepID=UPI001892266A|nr:hypothetical protein [Catenulispora pinisilvae]
MTLDELDAELSRMKAHNAHLKTSTVAELEAELRAATDPAMRRFLVGQLEAVKAINIPTGSSA